MSFEQIPIHLASIRAPCRYLNEDRHLMEKERLLLTQQKMARPVSYMFAWLGSNYFDHSELMQCYQINEEDGNNVKSCTHVISLSSIFLN